MKQSPDNKIPSSHHEPNSKEINADLHKNKSDFYEDKSNSHKDIDNSNKDETCQSIEGVRLFYDRDED